MATHAANERYSSNQNATTYRTYTCLCKATCHRGLRPCPEQTNPSLYGWAINDMEVEDFDGILPLATTSLLPPTISAEDNERR